ncbi:hypothetical protein L208DRAFT_1382082 [Tricholoma matsutake]|nr:hypothetical protein L208DRAFT_1382082 [Tricholoma matsutake 945]
MTMRICVLWLCVFRLFFACTLPDLPYMLCTNMLLLIGCSSHRWSRCSSLDSVPLPLKGLNVLGDSKCLLSLVHPFDELIPYCSYVGDHLQMSADLSPDYQPVLSANGVEAAMLCLPELLGSLLGFALDMPCHLYLGASNSACVVSRDVGCMFPASRMPQTCAPPLYHQKLSPGVFECSPPCCGDPIAEHNAFIFKAHVLQPDHLVTDPQTQHVMARIPLNKIVPFFAWHQDWVVHFKD